ncbi:glycosyltransferase [Enterococcus faecalis]|uniref:glycosyltransferase n=1 Tax=Enterococcus faecalis TaxID=1351 RepID=UPI0013871B0E|nr:glycosyltransferase [Enterococcus faecalis]MEB7428029.1 glycosyltransferase [Enterococcus faecalis]
MRKKVKMFVWNTFENDARVMRECTALSEKEFTVKLICLRRGNKCLKKSEKINDNFVVYRIDDINFSIISLLLMVLSLLATYFMNNTGATLFLILSILLLGIGKVNSFINKLWLISRMFLVDSYKSFDIYHANDLNTLPQAYFQAKILRIRKLVYDSHEVQTSRTGYESKLYGYLERFFMKRVDICIHENITRSKYTEYLYNRKIDYIYNYPSSYEKKDYPKGKIHSVLGISSDTPILLYQGGIQEGRGLETIVLAAQYIDKGTIVFIGDGKEKLKLKRLVKKLNVDDKVKFIDKVPCEMLKEFTIDAFLGFQVLENICFNHYSAASNKLFEYIMAEVPVIASDFPELARVIKTNKIGILVQPGNEQELAQAVNYLIKNSQFYKKCKKNCGKAKKIYTWEREKLRFLKIYSENVEEYGN